MLRDITGCSVPFGGKLLLLAGDFRQTLPVVPRAQPAAILEQCINRSNLWHHVTRHELTKNMRARPGEGEFSDWLIKLGDGSLQTNILEEPLPGQIDIPVSCEITDDIVQSIYPDFDSPRDNCTILTSKNNDTHLINNIALDRFNPTDHAKTYFSSDRVVEDDGNEVADFSSEFLHSLTPSGLPLHALKLKVGSPIMLLRNLDLKKGLCNGTRLTVQHLGDRFIAANVISGSAASIGNRVFIP